MSRFLQHLEIGSRLSASGITQTVRNTRVDYDNKTGDPIFTNGFVGYSVTQILVPTTQRWAIELYTDLGTGGEVRVGGLTGIGTTTSGFVPLEQWAGTTQAYFTGFPRISTIDVVGSSTAVGTSFGVVLTIAAGNP